VSEQQVEFALDYKKLYQPLEEYNLMIFKLYFCETPYLLNAVKRKNAIKHKTFIDKGPL
jgi:hypothetical protein